MKKVTLHKDLVPYVLPFPEVRPDRAVAQDLIHNYLLGCKLIRVVSVLFQLRRDTTVFSGYVYDKPDATFKIRLIHKGEEVRCITLSNLGYGGVLRAEILCRKIESAVGLDLLASLKVPDFGVAAVGLTED